MCVSCVCSALLSSVLVFFEEVKKCALFLSLMAVGFLLLTLLLLSSSLILCGGDAGGVCVCVCDGCRGARRICPRFMPLPALRYRTYDN